MIISRLRSTLGTMRVGFSAGFVVGMVNIFLILIGIPIRIEGLALFVLLLIPFIFGLRLVRKLHEHGIAVLVKNVLAMGVTAAVIVLLFLSLINRWQANGVDVKTYFDAVNTQTIRVLSGVPESELFANPVKNPLTGEYPEGAVMRTNPMRLTFNRETGLHLKLGFSGEAWIDATLVIGGLYGFGLLIILFGLLGAATAVLTRVLQLGQVQKQTRQSLAGNPIMHWVVLFLPLILFAVLWLTKSHGSRAAILNLGGSRQEIQLLLSFGIILSSLVAVRSAEETPRFNYQTRLGINSGLIAFMALLGILRITSNNTYFMTFPREPKGSETLCILAVLVVGVLLVAQNVSALRRADRFETQLAGTLAAGLVLLMPLFLDQYQNDVLTLVGINILLGLGLNIVVGYAGLLDLGYVAFFALGAYTYAFLSSNQVVFDSNNQPTGLKFAGNDEMVIKLMGWVVITVILATLVIWFGLRLWRQSAARHSDAIQARTLLQLPAYPARQVTLLLTVIAVAVSFVVASLLDGSGVYHDVFERTPPFLVGLIAGMIVAAISGVLLGIPVLRLRGDYLAIVTLGFGEIIRLLFNNLRDYTGGPAGVLLIPRPLPEGASGAISYLSIIYLVFLGAGVVALFSARLKTSRTGRAWSAMRSDEDIARSMGVNLVQSKLAAFAIGATFAGIGGVIFAARQRNIFPADFNLEVSIEVLSLVIIGGMGSIPGVIMGAIVLIGVPEVLRELAQYRILAFGALLVTMVIIRPSGILPAPPTRLQDRARALVHAEPSGEESLS